MHRRAALFLKKQEKKLADLLTQLDEGKKALKDQIEIEQAAEAQQMDNTSCGKVRVMQIRFVKSHI